MMRSKGIADDARLGLETSRRTTSGLFGRRFRPMHGAENGRNNDGRRNDDARR